MLLVVMLVLLLLMLLLMMMLLLLLLLLMCGGRRSHILLRHERLCSRNLLLPVDQLLHLQRRRRLRVPRRVRQPRCGRGRVVLRGGHGGRLVTRCGGRGRRGRGVGDRRNVRRLRLRLLR